jgi:hypothetical protein
MKKAFSLYLCLLLLIGMVYGEEKSKEYSQTYTIIIRGAIAGSEVVTEKIDSDGNLLSSSEHEIYLTDGRDTKRMAFTTKMVLSKDKAIPISYSCRYTTGDNRDSYEVYIKDRKINRILNRGGQTSDVTVPFQPDMIILDINVYHHYDYLVRRYDSKKGGNQTFANFIPIIGNDVPVHLTYLGNEKLELPSGILDLRIFRLDGTKTSTFSVDKDGRLVRLVIPAQDLEVLRSDITALSGKH